GPVVCHGARRRLRLASATLVTHRCQPLDEEVWHYPSRNQRRETWQGRQVARRPLALRLTPRSDIRSSPGPMEITGILSTMPPPSRPYLAGLPMEDNRSGAALSPPLCAAPEFGRISIYQ